MTFFFRATLAALLLGIGWSPSAFAQSDLAQPGACVDSDGDGYGWNGAATCDPTASSGSFDNSGDTGASACIDTDGDGYGWDGTATCLINDTPSLPQTPAQAPPTGVDSTCVDSDGDGYGWNAATLSTCLISAAGPLDDGNNADSEPTDTGPSDDNVSGSPDSGAPAPAPTPVSGGTTFTSTFAPIGNVAADQCLTRQDALTGNYPGAITAGDFILSINAWNFGAAGSYPWEQCVFANNGGLGWTYDWGPGGGSGDFFVRSYPELIFGVKSGGEISGSSAREGTGLPERVDQLPLITIDYDFTSNQNGPARPADASANPRFPNGTTIFGERNIAIESFFHPSDANGNCPASVVQRGSGQTNHTFELMVWIDSGAERLPAGPNGFVTTVNLDGATYDVYTKDNDLKYIAFVRTSASLSGSLNWSSFIEWTRDNAHRVSSRFGAITDAVQLQDDWCLANILVGNEIWWGEGDFTINQWQVNRTY